MTTPRGARPRRRATPPRAVKPRTVPIGAPEPVYFPSAAAFGRWLAANHAKATHLWVGYHKVGSGTPSLTWPESVDEALCVGWIDGVRKRVDATRYTIRFTPRKPGSHWSAVNVRRVEALKAEGRMRPAGLAAFARRREDPTEGYSYERRPHDLPPEYARLLKADREAWAFFHGAIASYRRACAWWVVSAKREETRARRLAQLIAHSKAGRFVPMFLVPAKARAQQAATAAKPRPRRGRTT